jgi:CRISPR-associated protein Cas2
MIIGTGRIMALSSRSNPTAKQRLAALAWGTGLPIFGAGSLPDSLPERIEAYLQFLTQQQPKANSVTILILYDITSNKVRRLVAKYLEEKGCRRVQKSVFLGQLSKDTIRGMANDLSEVNAAYDNTDSILFVYLPEDALQKTRMIGKSFDFEAVVNPPRVVVV